MQLIKDAFPKYYWVGVYVLHGNELRVGPYVGPTTDHVRIPVGRGVCGTAVAQGKNQIVGDVRLLDNYLACNLQTRSEIVVLVRDVATGDEPGEILGQIDIDSTEVSGFTTDDEAFLESVGHVLAPAMKALRDA
jgi:GAF domain-containing protein